MTEQTMRGRARETICDIVYDATGEYCPHWAGDKIYLAILSILAEPTSEMVEAAGVALYGAEMQRNGSRKRHCIEESWSEEDSEEYRGRFRKDGSAAFTAAIRKAGEG